MKTLTLHHALTPLSRLNWLFHFLFLTIASPVILLAETPDSPEPEAAFDSVEIAYWTSLNRELAELRQGNALASIRTIPTEASVEALSAIATRLEQFLDRRDADPVADLGDELKAYRKEIIELVDLALSPVIEAAQFNSTIETDGMERMARVLNIRSQINQIDSKKPQLAQLHQSINSQMLAVGSAPAPFFQVLAIGDKPNVVGILSDPAERDTQFLRDSQSILPVFGELAEHILIKWRDERGLSPQAIMDSVQSSIIGLRNNVADASLEELQEIESMRRAAETPQHFDLPRRLIQLEIFRRTDRVAFQLSMQDWQGAYARWTGEGDPLAPIGIPTDVAVAPDGRWFAHATDEHTLVVRTAAGETAFTINTDAPLRTLTALYDGDIQFFTADGVYQVEPTLEIPQPYRQAARPARFMQPRMAAARNYERTAFGIGVMPGVSTGLSENTFASDNPASRISAVGISGDGRRVAYGYANDTFLPGGNRNHGVFVLTFDQGPIDTDQQIEAAHAPGLILGVVTAIDMDETGEQLVFSVHGQFGGSISHYQWEENTYEPTVLAIDNQPYSWVRLLEDEARRVIAGTRHGIVRIWNVDTEELEQRFEVPAGVDGVGYGLIDGELLTIAIGGNAVHRWSIVDGKHLATLEGETPEANATLLAEQLDTERNLRRKVYARLVSALQTQSNEDRLKATQELRSEYASALDALGLRDMINSWHAGIRRSRMAEMMNNQQEAAAYAMGKRELDAGVIDEALIDITVQAGKLHLIFSDGPKSLYPELIAMAEHGAALYPTRLRLQTNLLELKARYLASNRRFADALREVDQLDQLNPVNAPHGELRISILYEGYEHTKDNNPRQAARYLFETIQYEVEKERQLIAALNAFALANRANDWQTSLDAANIALNLDSQLQNDQSFMHWARHAYQQVHRR